MLIEHAIQPPRLINIPRNTVGNMLRRIAREMIRLALHRPHAGVLVEEPIINCVVFWRTLRVGDLVVFVVLLDEVLQDAAGFEEVDGSVVEGVC